MNDTPSGIGWWNMTTDPRPLGSIWDEAQAHRNPGGDAANFNNESGVTGVY